ncbi:DUF3761 domain-containing protein [Acetobacter sp. DmW_136]|uniref:DUF3761 domain-containing protein n=1 Tax=Acetobacter sp. DmW_136 TaxID=2591091 RepID=UPI00123AF28D|nr:DUF3761 domain-containing protein [Acetobacter sp. DmW_136]
MRKVLSFGLLAFALSAHAAHALAPSTYQSPPVRQQPQQPDESALLEHQHYQNSDGNSVHSPAHTRTGQAPSGATAKCGDGTFSFSQNHRGTCSRHGGVVSWL